MHFLNESTRSNSLCVYNTDSHLRGSLLITASSRSKGLFVAARTKTRSLSFVRSPSQFTINSFFILRMASCSPGFSLLPNILSTYRMKCKGSAGTIATGNNKALSRTDSVTTMNCPNAWHDVGT